jgi:tRNA pseudouridine55 synthase
MHSMIGVLNIDKPAGITSHDVVARVRKIIGERRVGHTGTLDPFATGVLVVLVGRATRLAQFLSGAQKEYEALIRFGYMTDTGDVAGRRLETETQAKMRSAQSLRKEEIESAMESLRGEIEQTPPMYSAKKIAGRKLYEHARRGEEVERQPVRVTIHEFELITNSGEFLRANEDGSADLRVRVVCSAGTYVRVLAEDLGRKLGVGGHLAELRRIRAGNFKIEDAITLDELARLNETTSLNEVLISPAEALSAFPEIELDEKQAQATKSGIDLQVMQNSAAPWAEGDSVRLSYRGELVAMGKFDRERGVVHPAVVLTID